MNTGNAYEMIVSRMMETKDEVLASEMGCDRSQISRIRSGERGVRIKELDRLLTALGLVICTKDGVTMTPSMASSANPSGGCETVRRYEVRLNFPNAQADEQRV